MADYRFFSLAASPGHGILMIGDKPHPARFLTLEEAKSAQFARMASAK